MKAQIESFVIEKSNGESIFKIEMVNQDCKSWLNFNCTIEIDYNKNPVMQKSVREILSSETTEEQAMQITQKILEQVTTIEGIKQCKMWEYSNKNCDTDDDTYRNYLLDFAFKPDTMPFTPYSLRKNISFFKRFVRKMAPFTSNMVEAERSLFEELIAGYPELEEEYVNNYSAEASFYFTEVCLGDECHQFYMMYSNGIKLFFYTEIE